MDFNVGGLESVCVAVIAAKRGFNDVWCRQRCGAGRTRPCHVLLVKAMVTGDRHYFSKRVVSQQRWQKQFYRKILPQLKEKNYGPS